MNTFTFPLMSEMSDWYALPGHVPKAQALRTLIKEGILDWICDEIEFKNSRPCDDCEGDGCGVCDDMGVIVMRKQGLMEVARSFRHSWVKRDEDRIYEEWYKECSDLDEGAEPATVFSI